MIKVVNKYKELEHRYIYCGRGSALGNPFPMRNETERDKVCTQYEDWFYSRIDEPSFLDLVELPISQTNLNPQTKQLIIIFRMAMKGDINLGCFCAPKRCHCDTIKNFLDNKIEESFK